MELQKHGCVKHKSTRHCLLVTQIYITKSILAAKIAKCKTCAVCFFFKHFFALLLRFSLAVNIRGSCPSFARKRSQQRGAQKVASFSRLAFRFLSFQLGNMQWITFFLPFPLCLALQSQSQKAAIARHRITLCQNQWSTTLDHKNPQHQKGRP